MICSLLPPADLHLKVLTGFFFLIQAETDVSGVETTLGGNVEELGGGTEMNAAPGFSYLDAVHLQR